MVSRGGSGVSQLSVKKGSREGFKYLPLHAAVGIEDVLVVLCMYEPGATVTYIGVGYNTVSSEALMMFDAQKISMDLSPLS